MCLAWPVSKPGLRSQPGKRVSLLQMRSELWESTHTAISKSTNFSANVLI